MNENIKELKKERDSIKRKIKRKFVSDDHSGMRELVKEFNIATDQLIKIGSNVYIDDPIMLMDSWTENDVFIGKLDHTINKDKKQQKTSSELFTINIAWTESDDHNVDGIINKLKEYFDEVGFTDEGESSQGKEHILKYSIKTNDAAFEVIRLSSMFVLDVMSKSDYEKFNIAIYGKKVKK